jgi:copper chaperone
MEKSIIKVNGMSCQHCAMSVTNALKNQPGVSSAAVDLAAKTVTVDYSPEAVSIEKIKEAIKDLGYEIID